MPSLFLAPKTAPSIVRAYIEFILNGTWPYGGEGQASSLIDLLNAHGKKQYPFKKYNDYINIKMNGDGGEQESRYYRLHREYYEIYGSDKDMASGTIVKLGKFFCLSKPTETLLNFDFDRQNCARIIEKNGNLFWEKLGDSRPVPISLIS